MRTHPLHISRTVRPIHFDTGVCIVHGPHVVSHLVQHGHAKVLLNSHVYSSLYGEADSSYYASDWLTQTLLMPKPTHAKAAIVGLINQHDRQLRHLSKCV